MTSLLILFATFLIIFCAQGEESFGLTQEDVDRFAIDFLKKKNIKIKKNIDVLVMPAMRLTPSSARKPVKYLMPFQSLDKCEDLCSYLFVNGYVTQFAINVGQSGHMVRQVYGEPNGNELTHSEFIRKYHLKTVNKEEIVTINNQKYIVIYEVQNGAFVYMSMVKMGKEAKSRKNEYRSSEGGEFHSSETHVTWYELFDKVKIDKYKYRHKNKELTLESHMAVVVAFFDLAPDICSKYKIYIERNKYISNWMRWVGVRKKDFLGAGAYARAYFSAYEKMSSEIRRGGEFSWCLNIVFRKKEKAWLNDVVETELDFAKRPSVITTENDKRIFVNIYLLLRIANNKCADVVPPTKPEVWKVVAKMGYGFDIPKYIKNNTEYVRKFISNVEGRFETYRVREECLKAFNSISNMRDGHLLIEIKPN